jgi:ABC-2 type transport system permease protein
MRSYLPIARATYMIGIVYRFGFLFTILGNIVYLGVAYYLWKSIYTYSDTIRGLTFNETFLYVGLGSAIFILLKTYADWFIHYEIREGNIATYLTKPIDYQIYNLFANLGSLLINLTAITLPTVLVMIFIFKVNVAPGIGLLLFPISLLLAFLISFSIDYFIGLLGSIPNRSGESA